MGTLMKADIFFFAVTIMVALVSIFLVIALCYVIKILRRTTILYNKIEENINTVDIHIKEIIGHIKESFLFNFLFMKRKNKKKDP